MFIAGFMTKTGYKPLSNPHVFSQNSQNWLKYGKFIEFMRFLWPEVPLWLRDPGINTTGTRNATNGQNYHKRAELPQTGQKTRNGKSALTLVMSKGRLSESAVLT